MDFQFFSGLNVTEQIRPWPRETSRGMGFQQIFRKTGNAVKKKCLTWKLNPGTKYDERCIYTTISHKGYRATSDPRIMRFLHAQIHHYNSIIKISHRERGHAAYKERESERIKIMQDVTLKPCSSNDSVSSLHFIIRNKIKK